MTEGCEREIDVKPSPVAQSVEQLAVNQLVGGSSPSRGASLDEKALRQLCRRAFYM